MCEEATIFRTPRRNRVSTRPEGNVQRRRSLFTELKESDDDITSLSPTSSEVGTPLKESPIGSVKNLESNFNQLLLNRTPNKDFSFTPPHISPRIRGVKFLSEDADLIKKNTFYGGRSLTAPATGPVDGKSLFASIRSSIPLKVRTRLFPDDAPKEKKKRGRTASFLDSAKRAKKRPRLQETLPSISKNLAALKENRLKKMVAAERLLKKANRGKKLRQLTIDKSPLEEIPVESETNSAKKNKPVKRRYNWEIFSSNGDSRFLRSLNSSVTMTPPATGKKKKLMSSSATDYLHTPQKSQDENISEITKNIIENVNEMIQDEEIGFQNKVNDLLLQLEQSDEENDSNCFELQNVTTPTQCPSTPSTDSSSQPKLFPIFNRTPGSSVSGISSPSIITPAKKSTPTLKGIGSDQMLLDCGQNKLREVQCPTCEVVYVQGVPEDEVHHAQFHSTFTQMSYKGFKNENIVGIDGANKVILVRPQGDARMWRKALEYKQVVDAEFGAPEGDALPDQIYLYIKGKNVVGLLCAMMIKKAHRLLPPLGCSAEDPDLPALCTEESFPAKCGVTRLWVSPTARKQGVATAMMDALRRNFLYGTLLKLDDVAMSSPTVEGRLFSYNYFKRNDFLVY